jgi:uncharacterized membrane protein YagU involved in acid resistance
MLAKEKLMGGFAAGFLATLPMTVWMLTANRLIPARKPDPLPPEEITENLIQKAELEPIVNDAQKKQASLVNHFLYGGLLGMPFGLFKLSDHAGQAVKQGLLYGLFVWISNYLGLLPAVRLYPSATWEPARMNAIMIIAHLCWGGSLGWLLGRFSARYMAPASFE